MKKLHSVNSVFIISLLFIATDANAQRIIGTDEIAVMDKSAQIIIRESISKDAPQPHIQLRSLIPGTPSSAEWRYLYGGILVDLALQQRASRKFEAAIESATEAFRNYTLALQILDKSSGVNEADTHEQLGFLLETFLNDKAGAAKHYQTAIAMGGDDKRLNRKLRNLRLGQP